MFSERVLILRGYKFYFTLLLFNIFIRAFDKRNTEIKRMKLIFIYNADSGLMNTLMDIGHKAISPQTYECNLCGLTFGVLSEHKQWKKFRESSEIEMEFLHRDEFEKKYGQEFEYPIVLKQDSSLDVAISKTKLNEIKTLDELIYEVKHLY